jgi:hypothetical protein
MPSPAPGAGSGYGDFSREHLVRNTRTTVTRIHVVIDALLTSDLAAWLPPSWQPLVHHGEVLLSHIAPAGPCVCPGELPHEVLMPSGFADFDAPAPLDGSRRRAGTVPGPGQ